MTLYQVVTIFIISGLIPPVFFYIRKKKEMIGPSLALLGVVIVFSGVLIFANDIIIYFR